MGVSYSVAAGYGFQVSEKRLRKLDSEQYDDVGPFEVLDDLLREYPDLDYAWAGNAYSGYDGGFIVFLKSHSYSVDGYAVKKVADFSLNEKKQQAQLANAFQRIAKRKVGMGWFVASSVG